MSSKASDISPLSFNLEAKGKRNVSFPLNTEVAMVVPVGLPLLLKNLVVFVLSFIWPDWLLYTEFDLKIFDVFYFSLIYTINFHIKPSLWLLFFVSTALSNNGLFGDTAAILNVIASNSYYGNLRECILICIYAMNNRGSS